MNKERQQHDHDVQRRVFKKYILPVTLQDFNIIGPHIQNFCWLTPKPCDGLHKIVALATCGPPVADSWSRP
jgi:hypothetical protein